jgi:SecD-like export protein
MDDRDLEARLHTHLRRRFDDAEPPRELRASLEQAFATQPRSLGLFDRRVHSPVRLGLSLTGAAVAVVVLAIAATNLALRFGPAGNGPSPSPSGPTERDFIVLPPGSDVLPKPDSIVAGDVLMARLRALGVGTFSMGGGYGMTFTLPAGGPSDDAIRTVLAAPGVLEFVRIPAGTSEVTAGQSLPATLPVLFGSEGVASIRDATDQNGNPALNVNLTPAAAQLFADYSTNHIGEQLAIVVDGRVVSAPIIQAPITGGQLQITNASSASGFTLDAPIRAILIGGTLPEPWRGAPVPEVISRAEAIADASRDETTQPTGVESTSLEALLLGIGRWTAVWKVTLLGDFPGECAPAPPPASCAPASSRMVVLDASTGGFIDSQAPAP